MMVNRTKRTPSKREQFFEQLRRDGNVSRSCEAVQLARTTVYGWRSADPDFAAAWDEAVNLGINGLEDEAIRRALKSSDTLLMFMLRARRPEVYGERIRSEVTGADGGAVLIRYVNHYDDGSDPHD